MTTSSRFGVPMVQKLGMDATDTGGFAGGYWQTAGFVADAQSPFAPFFLDAIAVPIPTSGGNALSNFSVVASGTLSNSAGPWVFNICVAQPLPPLVPISVIKGAQQILPVPCASAVATLTVETSFVLAADVTVGAGGLSGVWFLTLDGADIANGTLTNLPGNLSQEMAAYLQIGQMPPGASISNIVLQVWVANGYTGLVQTLNAP
jgi:hypothetical protein